MENFMHSYSCNGLLGSCTLTKEKNGRVLDKAKYEEVLQQTHDQILRSAPILRKEAARAFMFSEIYQRLLVKKEAGDMKTGMKRTIGQLKMKGIIPADINAAAEVDLALNEEGKKSEDEVEEEDHVEEGGEIGEATICEFHDLLNLDPEKDEFTDTFLLALEDSFKSSSSEMDDESSKTKAI